jgi:hypothetical protein
MMTDGDLRPATARPARPFTVRRAAAGSKAIRLATTGRPIQTISVTSALQLGLARQGRAEAAVFWLKDTVAAISANVEWRGKKNPSFCHVHTRRCTGQHLVKVTCLLTANLRQRLSPFWRSAHKCRRSHRRTRPPWTDFILADTSTPETEITVPEPAERASDCNLLQGQLILCPVRFPRRGRIRQRR